MVKNKIIVFNTNYINKQQKYNIFLFEYYKKKMKYIIIFTLLAINYLFLDCYKIKNLKIAICTMAREENLYIKQFVDYYLKLGIDHIFIYDDNEPNTEKISDVLHNPYKSHVTIYDNIINKTLKGQPQAYTLCYNNNKNTFDWIFMCDIDEYLIIKNNTLKNYLSNESFQKCDFVKIHWVVPTDNNILHYDNRPLLERLKGPYLNDTHVKTFVKGNIEDLKYDIHSPFSSPFRNISCNNNGEKYNTTKVFFNDVFDINYDKAYIIHFKYKSTEEYIKKYKRGYRWENSDFLKMRIREYFSDNKITLEKIQYVENELKLDLSKYKKRLFKNLQ